MNSLAFFDTNIFVYPDDAADPGKQAKAIRVSGQYQRPGQAVLSSQVLQQYFSLATRKLGLAPGLAQRKV